MKAGITLFLLLRIDRVLLIGFLLQFPLKARSFFFFFFNVRFHGRLQTCPELLIDSHFIVLMSFLSNGTHNIIKERHDRLWI